MLQLAASGTKESRIGSLLPARLLWRTAFAALPMIFMLRLSYYVMLDAAEGHRNFLGHRLLNESTGALLAAIPLAMLCWIALRMPLARPVRARTVAAFVVCFVVGTLGHTTAMVVVRAAIGPRLGWREYGFDLTPARFGYEAANDLVYYVAAIAMLALAETVARQRDRERRAAALEESLLRAELSNLRLQLQPHFLFNALNTISSTMYEDVDAADRLLGRLSELLRASLRTTHVQEVALGEELSVLRHYLDLMHARFGDSLTVSIDVGTDLLEMNVPSLVLQPLVENAVRHGGITRLGHGAVVVAAAHDRDMLVLRVHDDGPVDDAHATNGREPGIGLSTTAKRLRYLYGDQQSLRAGPAAHGGFAVELRIPARR